MLKKSIKIIALSFIGVYTPGVQSAAFGIAEQSALGLGSTFSGGAAVPENASTIWFNPAGMTRINSNQLVLGAHLIEPSFNFDEQGSTTGLGAPITADSSNDFVLNTKIDRQGSTGDHLFSKYESDADILSAQIRWNL